jgi:aminoglycoside 2'-N-acetyltransferase I
MDILYDQSVFMATMTAADRLDVEVVASDALSASDLDEVRALCSDAYREDFTRTIDQIGPGWHLLGRREGILVSHVMWVTRFLQPTSLEPLRTAYVEAVATEPACQRRGYATALLRRLADEVQDYDLAALAPSDETFYARLGWEVWRGPLLIRRGRVLEATPDETVMVLRLPRTPGLDLDEPLSAEWRRGELW